MFLMSDAACAAAFGSLDVVVNCAANSYTVGGTTTGLVGTVVLQDNGGDNLTLNANGSFAFPAPLAGGDIVEFAGVTVPRARLTVLTWLSSLRALLNIVTAASELLNRAGSSGRDRELLLKNKGLCGCTDG